MREGGECVEVGVLLAKWGYFSPLVCLKFLDDILQTILIIVGTQNDNWLSDTQQLDLTYFFLTGHCPKFYKRDFVLIVHILGL
jgi:hypothetical protein